MSTFGEKLKAERERRNTPLTEIASRTRIGIQYLEALECDNFDELPGPRGFGKLYIRAYAEMLGFDPAPLILEYDEIVHRRLREAGEEDGEPTRPRMRRIRYVPPPRAGANGGTLRAARDEEPELPELEDVEDEVPVKVPAELPEREIIEALPEPHDTGIPPREPARRSWLIGAGVGALLFVAVLGVLWIAQRDAPGEIAMNRAPTTPAVTERVTEDVALPALDDSAVTDEATDATEAATVVEEPAAVPEPEPTRRTASMALSVGSAGVGTGVSNLRLVGEASTFREGQVVSFLTRVRGGAAGQRIRHVWIHEGRAVQSIPLTLGSANWRTYSNKTVWANGAWAVEARAGDGRVLARSEFDVRRSRR